jgi:hypothetical protein
MGFLRSARPSPVSAGKASGIWTVDFTMDAANLSIGVTITCKAGRSSQRSGETLVSPGGGDVAGEEEDGWVVGARGRPPPTEALRKRSHGLPGPHLLPPPHISTHPVKVAILFFYYSLRIFILDVAQCNLELPDDIK